jgi:hypothetical protein
VADASIKGEYTALVKDAASGDRDAMERLLVRAQEAAYRWMKTYQHVTQIGEPESFRTWLYTTVKNACLMKRRRHVGEPATFVSLDQDAERADRSVLFEVADESRPADQRLIDDWMGHRLHEALKALPPSYRMIVVMREIEGPVDEGGCDGDRVLRSECQNAFASGAAHVAPQSARSMTPEPDDPCAAILANISAYLDGELDATACDAIEQHCRQCSTCAPLVAGLRETVGLCRQAASLPLPDAVRQRARDSVRQLLDRQAGTD